MIKLFVALLFYVNSSLAAISANAVYELRSGATAGNVNGCGFVTGATGVDYSQQTAAQYNLTNATSVGAGAIILHASAATDMVGNIAHVISGTNFTAGWYEIISVVAGVSITVDRNVTTGAGATGVVNIGGACSLGAANDDAVFELAIPGNIYYMKGGDTFNLGGTVNIAAAGTALKGIKWFGYNGTRATAATPGNMPIVNNNGTAIFTTGVYWMVSNVVFNGTGSTVLQASGKETYFNIKVRNFRTAASGAGLTTANYARAIESEFISYRGIGVSMPNSAGLYACYIHDSDVGIASGGADGVEIIGNLIAGNVTFGIDMNGSNTFLNFIIGNTIYGAQNKLGIGMDFATGISTGTIMNNILYGLTTGLNHADAGQTSNFENYNDFFNNTADVTNFVKGSNDLALNPNFISVTQYTGSTATTSGSVLTQAAAAFPTFTPGVDFVYIVSGTGITAGVYGITSNTGTTITLDIAPGTSATADKVFQVTTGRNWGIGTPLRAQAVPFFFGSTATIPYVDTGAVQRRERITTGSSH